MLASIIFICLPLKEVVVLVLKCWDLERTVEGLACGLGLVTVLTTHCVVIHCRALRLRGTDTYGA
jgi:hypothetical protein